MSNSELDLWVSSAEERVEVTFVTALPVIRWFLKTWEQIHQESGHGYYRDSKTESTPAFTDLGEETGKAAYLDLSTKWVCVLCEESPNAINCRENLQKSAHHCISSHSQEDRQTSTAISTDSLSGGWGHNPAAYRRRLSGGQGHSPLLQCAQSVNIKKQHRPQCHTWRQVAFITPFPALKRNSFFSLQLPSLPATIMLDSKVFNFRISYSLHSFPYNITCNKGTHFIASDMQWWAWSCNSLDYPETWWPRSSWSGTMDFWRFIDSPRWEPTPLWSWGVAFWNVN